VFTDYKKVSNNLLLAACLLIFANQAEAITIENWKAKQNDIVIKNDGISLQNGKTGIAGDEAKFSSIGAARRSVLQNDSTIEDFDITLKVSNSKQVLAHSQEANVIGKSITIWDGAKEPSNQQNYFYVNNKGLGGIDFTTDGSTMFIINIDDDGQEFRNKNAFIIVSVYKYGVEAPYYLTLKSSEVKAKFPQEETFDIELSFKNFKNSDGDSYDFKDVGAISLEINGENAPKLDVTIGAIKTNGCQDFIPSKGYTYGYLSMADRMADKKTCCVATLDQCQICGGKNECLDCDGTIDGTKQLDECGKCLEPTDPSFNSCIDCTGAKRTGIHKDDYTLDECKVCRAKDDPYRNKSCADCAGEPNGSHKQDACGRCDTDPNYGKECKDTPICEEGEVSKSCACREGIIKDECGVCGGDGTSCRDCENVIHGQKQIDLCEKCLDVDDLNWNKCVDCSGVPNGSKKLDLCNQCKDPSDYQNWNSCLDCDNVDGGKKKKDLCGHCLEETDPKWNDCVDCANVADGNKQIDSCGECLDPTDENWNSCVDCAGVPFGKSRYDDCGECLEIDSPAWNLGLGTFNCTLKNNANDLKDTEKWLTQQRKYLKQMLNDRNYCQGMAKKRKENTKALSILSSAKATINSYPTSVTSCESTAKSSCITSSLSADNSILTDAAAKLLSQTNQALKIRKACIGNNTNTCEKADGCLNRLKKRLLQIRKDRQSARELRKNTLDSISNLPKTQSVCTCGTIDDQ